MPIDKYFKGAGSRVMAAMKDRYGKEKGEQVFYATAAKKKQGMEPPSKLKKAMKSAITKRRKFQDR